MTNLSTFVKRIRDIMRNDAGINGDAQRIEQIAWMLFLKVYDTKEQDWEFDEEDYTSIIPAPCRWCNWAHDEKDGKATYVTIHGLEQASRDVRSLSEDALREFDALSVKDDFLRKLIINLISRRK